MELIPLWKYGLLELRSVVVPKERAVNVYS